jgi:hypothetical protein
VRHVRARDVLAKLGLEVNVRPNTYNILMLYKRVLSEL